MENTVPNAVHVNDGRDGFVGIDEAAKFLGVSQATIRRMTASNRLKCYRFSRMGHRRFRKSDLVNAFQVRQEA
jgi:excisionase family DNA binding protein